MISVLGGKLTLIKPLKYAIIKNIMRKRCHCPFLIFFYLLIPFSLYAQTADEIEDLLEAAAVSYEQAARLVLNAANISDDYDRSNSEEAFRFAVKKRWLPKKTDPAKNINLKNFSLLIMRAFGFKGGPMYTIFKTPHYAYREMVYQDIIQGKTNPRMIVSGDMLLFLVNRVLYRTDENPWELPEEQEPVIISLPEEIRKEKTSREEDNVIIEIINSQLEAFEITDFSFKLTDNGIIINIFNNQLLADAEELPKERKEIEVLVEIGLILKSILTWRIPEVESSLPEDINEESLKASLERIQAIADYLIQLGNMK